MSAFCRLLVCSVGCFCRGCFLFSSILDICLKVYVSSVSLSVLFVSCLGVDSKTKFSKKYKKYAVLKRLFFCYFFY